VLFLIDLSAQRVEIAGLARRANGLWMSQVARNLNDVWWPGCSPEIERIATWRPRLRQLVLVIIRNGTLT
jgi:hypothetical protein